MQNRNPRASFHTFLNSAGRFFLISAGVTVALGNFSAFNAQAQPMFAWGAGPGTNVPASLTNIVSISGGMSHSLALRSDGTISAWGTNDFGQTNIPPGTRDIVAISAGREHSLALHRSGIPIAWGINDYNQATVPPGISNVVAIAAGGKHNLVLTDDGIVLAWGRNDSGQSSVPIGLTNVIAIAAGYAFSMALKSDGTVVSWGQPWACCSPGWQNYTNTPLDLTNVVAIAAGYFHRMALKADGTVSVWGQGEPVENLPPDLTNVIAIAAGYPLSAALLSDGSVITWGDRFVTNAPWNLPPVKHIAAGRNHVVALTSETPELATKLSQPHISGTTFTVRANTMKGWTYTLEWSPSLSENTWLPVFSAPGQGYGVVRTLKHANSDTPFSFYRVRRTEN